MKKFAKMSLVAAVALVGMSSTASAGSLEEAIKGVDISGQVRYRIEDASKGGAGEEDQDVNIDVKVKVPVNDNVTFVANANYDDDTQEGGATASDSSGTLDQYYFQYANGPVTTLLGTQDIPGRLTDSEEASGLVGLYNAGAFTVGAAAFYNADITSEAIYSVIAMGNVGPVSLLGQYVTADDVLDAYNLKADATFGPAKVGVEYSAMEFENDATAEAVVDPTNATPGTAEADDRSTFKAYINGKVSIVSATLAYVKTGDNGSGSIDRAVETPAEFLLWQMGSAGVADLDAFAIDASVAVTDKISLRAAYADGEAGDTDLSETLGQISYKMSKNLNTYFRYSEYEVEGEEDKNRGRVEVKYTF